MAQVKNDSASSTCQSVVEENTILSSSINLPKISLLSKLIQDSVIAIIEFSTATRYLKL